MVEKFFISPQVKRSVIISNKLLYICMPVASGFAEWLKKLGNQEISGKSQNLIELLPRAQTSS